MTDDREQGDAPERDRAGENRAGGDRAGEAFSQAFRRADAEPFEPLDPTALASVAPDRPAVPQQADGGAAVRARRRWTLPAVAAAVLLVLAIPLAVVLGQRLAPQPAMSSAESGAGPAAAPGGVPTGDTGAGTSDDWTAGDAGSGAPPDRTADEASGPTRTVTLPYGVLVDVPGDWGRATAPSSDWCAEGRTYPVTPYVGDPPSVVRAIACPDPIPADRLATHLTWVGPVEDAPAYGLPEGWSRFERTVGALTLVVVAPDADASLAESVLASARVG